jgi:glycosyltransferase involved in cell wall biosynthesis
VSEIKPKRKKQEKSLWIQIPCLNEEDNLPEVLQSLPKALDGIATINILVINDGSTDQTVNVAKSNGVVHIVSFSQNRGLSAAFQAGLDYCASHGADIIVNTDADNQYPSEYIEQLVRPILSGDADVVIGDRAPGKVTEFHPLKRLLQTLGSRLTSILCGAEIQDATSGFRAYSKEAAGAIFITNPYTYTLESLIQLSVQKFKIGHISIQKNPSKRPSRLFKNTFTYVRKNGLVLLKSYIQYAPMKFFGFLALILLVLGTATSIPFFSTYLTRHGNNHQQSLILSGVFLMGSIQMLGLALIGDAIRASRASAENKLKIIKNIIARDHSIIR